MGADPRVGSGAPGHEEGDTLLAAGEPTCPAVCLHHPTLSSKLKAMAQGV
jgi:hypothetical protein